MNRRACRLPVGPEAVLLTHGLRAAGKAPRTSEPSAGWRKVGTDRWPLLAGYLPAAGAIPTEGFRRQEVRQIVGTQVHVLAPVEPHQTIPRGTTVQHLEGTVRNQLQEQTQPLGAEPQGNWGDPNRPPGRNGPLTHP